MAANEPTAKNLADLYKLAPLDWDDVRGTLETTSPKNRGPAGLDTTPSGCRRSTPTAART
jgi:hypothetical protein